MRSPLPAVIAGLLDAHGEDAAACLRVFGLQDALTGAAVLAPLDSLRGFYADAAQRLGEPDLGLTLTQKISRGAYGLPEFSIRASSTVGEGLRRIARYATLINEANVTTLTETASELQVHVSIPGHPIGAGRHADEYYLALIAVVARTLTDGAFVVKRAWFPHAKPRSTRRHQEVFRTTKLEFQAPDSGFAIAAALAAVPLQSADPALTLAIDEQAERLLSQRSQTPELLDLVREWLVRSLHAGLVTLDDAARGVAMTPRTLQRRLSERDTSFRALLDDVRQEMLQGLREQDVPVEDIAYRLGYADMGSFRRALRRWER